MNNETIRKVVFEDLGVKDYKETWDYQEQLLKETVDLKLYNSKNQTNYKTTNRLLFVEHPAVFTIGKNGKMNHLLISEEVLKQRNIDFYKINRGGDITFHGLGQVVGYPIFDLDHFFTDIHKYLRCLEEVVILTLKDFGIESSRSDGETGVWIAPNTPFARKICAMGVKASRWVTMHGFALNVNTDLNYFNQIVPCGITGKSVTSMQKELGATIEINEVKKVLRKHFSVIFNFEWE